MILFYLYNIPADRCIFSHHSFYSDRKLRQRVFKCIVQGTVSNRSKYDIPVSSWFISMISFCLSPLIRKRAWSTERRPSALLYPKRSNGHRFVKVKLALNVFYDHFVAFQDFTFNQLSSASQFLPLDSLSMIMCVALFTFPLDYFPE